MHVSTVHVNSLVLFTDLLPLSLKGTNIIHITVTVFSSVNRLMQGIDVAEEYNDAVK